MDAEFEIYAEQDEEAFREFKARLRGRNDSKAASVLKFVTEFEETEEPDSMLKRLRDWLRAKDNDPPPCLWHGGSLSSKDWVKKITISNWRQLQSTDRLVGNLFPAFLSAETDVRFCTGSGHRAGRQQGPLSAVS